MWKSDPTSGQVVPRVLPHLHGRTRGLKHNSLSPHGFVLSDIKHLFDQSVGFSGKQKYALRRGRNIAEQVRPVIDIAGFQEEDFEACIGFHLCAPGQLCLAGGANGKDSAIARGRAS
jgi:hypothetical protein